MQNQIDKIVTHVSSIILGKDHQIRLAIACLLARGHLLIEDIPGVGKTTLAHALASALGLGFQRIQFTSDLLPADILGISIYNRDNSGFQFHPGPIFTQVVLADEVNRATPKAQSALIDYVQALVNYTRRTADYVNGLSPRAALALLHGARAWALMDGRVHVLPEDVQAVLSSVVPHRLLPAGDVIHTNGADLAAHLIKQVPIP